jgi:hypothetical protein
MRKVLAVGCIFGLFLAWTRLPLVIARAALPARAAQRPALSPHESTSATIDGAAVSITYGRPSMRGRRIFGNLVPFDRVWCPGADECTRLSTDRDLQFQGLTLKAGDYSLWMQPSAGSPWTLTFNGDGRAFHTRRDPRRDVGRIQLQRETLPAPVEQLTFSIEPNRGGGGRLVMRWEATSVSAPFTVVASR